MQNNLNIILKNKKEFKDNNLTLFTEKLSFINGKDSTIRSLKGKYSDKYLVRKYIENEKIREILNVLYDKWNTFDEIDFSLLPTRYVLKLTYGSGYNVIVKDEFDKNKAKKFLPMD